MPGESPSVFGDALRRLSGAATYLYQDGPRYWYSTQPTVTKLGRGPRRAAQARSGQGRPRTGKAPQSHLRQQGEFTRIHAMPRSGQEVPDDRDARLVVLGSDYPYSKEVGNPGQSAAKAILDHGNAPRLCRNTLVFLAADRPACRVSTTPPAFPRLVEFYSNGESARNLNPQQVSRPRPNVTPPRTVTARIPETYQWSYWSRPDLTANGNYVDDSVYAAVRVDGDHLGACGSRLTPSIRRVTS